MMQNTEHTAAPLLVRGGRVHDAVHPEPQQIDLLLENGRIVAMGHELNVPPISPCWMLPGWIFSPVLWMRTPISVWMVMASGTKAATTTR